MIKNFADIQDGLFHGETFSRRKRMVGRAYGMTEASG